MADLIKVTVRTRASYDSERKAPYTFNLSKRTLIRNALRGYYEKNHTIVDRQKDVGSDAINVARCKIIKQLLKTDFPKLK